MTERRALSVEAAYDRWAGSYDGYDNPMVFMARHALAREDFTGVDRAIEFGCGTGRNLILMQQAGVAQVIGLDLSFEMLRRVPAHLEAPVLLLRHDTSRPAPIRDQAADRVLFCLTLEHAADLRPAFAEAARILKPGGQVILFEIHPFFAFQGGKAHFKDAGEEIGMPTYAHMFSDYVTAAARAGLHLARSQEWRPIDLIHAGIPETDLPRKVLKRGVHMPLGISMAFKQDAASGL